MALEYPSDLHVSLTSNALAGVTLDVVISGSIAALQAPLFIRSLRRLGAQVFPVLSPGGEQFVTPMALEWAANNPVTTGFSGLNTHISIHDAVVVAPASANTIASLAGGLSSTPGLALIQSALGQKKPVFVLPTMHASLYDSPLWQKTLEVIKPFTTVLTPRREEGKYKFPEPKALADIIAHGINAKKIQEKTIVITLGGTKAYLDDVRYLGNYSTGALGSLIAEELYRLGAATWVIAGQCEKLPQSYSKLIRAETYAEMDSSCKTCMQEGAEGLVMAAAILDYEPEQKISGKLASGESGLSFALKKTGKIISFLNPKGPAKVAFKLVSKKMTPPETWENLAREYCSRYKLSMLVINNIEDVSLDRHVARTFETCQENLGLTTHEFHDKVSLASFIANHVFGVMNS